MCPKQQGLQGQAALPENMRTHFASACTQSGGGNGQQAASPVAASSMPGQAGSWRVSWESGCRCKQQQHIAGMPVSFRRCVKGHAEDWVAEGPVMRALFGMAGAWTDTMHACDVVHGQPS